MAGIVWVVLVLVGAAVVIMSELGGGEKIVEGREDRNVEIAGKVPGKTAPYRAPYRRSSSPVAWDNSPARIRALFPLQLCVSAAYSSAYW